MAERVSLSSTPAVAVLEHQGISPAHARRALQLQSRIAKTRLVDRVKATLASAYAGMWFQPGKAKLHIGVTSKASSRAAAHLAAKAGLGAAVVSTRVRSTRAALVAAQERWNVKLAQMLPQGGSLTGIASRPNAVVVKLSAELPASQRAALKRAAAEAAVNIQITTVPPRQVSIMPKANTKCEFANTFGEVPTYAWCEKTITSGVTIESDSQRCTAGPMMIKGTKTFVLTAGHCIANGDNEIGEVWKSDWPNPNPPRRADATKKLGVVSASTYDDTLDSAEIEVERPGEFTNALPTPVPALMSEWGNWRGYTGKPPKGQPPTPLATAPTLQFESKAVIGEGQPVEGFANCHEGKTTGEQCGVVGMERVVPNPAANGVGTENLVEDSACAEAGDSGGPYFHYGPSLEIIVEGTLVGGPADNCNNTGTGGTQVGGGAPINYYEPMKALLAAYPGQRLLTAANQLRKPRVKGAKGATLKKKSYTGSSGATTIETIGGSKLACSADSAKGEASAESSGTMKLTLTGCEAFGRKCQTSGAAEGEVALSANYKLVFVNGAKDEVGLLLELTEAAVTCGKNCEGKALETLKLRGTTTGAVAPIDEEVVPSKKFTITFSQTKGVQSPTEYEKEEGSKAKAVFELEGSGEKIFKFEQAGLSDTETLLFEEAAEIEA